MGDNKIRVNVMLDPLALDRLKNAAAALPAESVSSLLEKGGLAYVEVLEREQGVAFPQRKADPVGRPRKAT